MNPGALRVSGLCESGLSELAHLERYKACMHMAKQNSKIKTHDDLYRSPRERAIHTLINQRDSVETGCLE